mmetsp:Transcript_33916/g.105345  ORF Transcript_33916/g.105345 Transcript_33916/m.105345 type:complete len:508 (+) Transcript_33916:86-1609(+)
MGCPWPLSSMAFTWRDSVMGLRYVGLVWLHASIVLLVGFVLGVLPTALLTRWEAASKLTRNHWVVQQGQHNSFRTDVGAAGMRSPSDETLPAYLIFWVWRCLLVTSWAFLTPVIALWADRALKGMAAHCLLGGVFLLGFSTLMIYALFLRFGGPFVGVSDRLYIGIFVLIMVVNIVVAFGSASTEFRKSPRAIVAAMLIACAQAGTHQAFVATMKYLFSHPHWLIQMLLIPTIVTGLRSICLELVFKLVCQVPGLGVWGRSLLVIQMNSMCLATYQMLQVTSSDHLRTALTYACVALSEVCRNGTFLMGMTEVEYYASCFMEAIRLCRGRASRVSPEVPVHAFDGVEPVEDGLSMSPPSSQRAEDASTVDDVPGGHLSEEEDEKVRLLYELVRATNTIEPAVMVQIVALFLIAKLNPYEVAGAPIAPGVLLINLATGMVTEVLTDFFTAIVGGARTHELNADCSMRWGLLLCLSMCMSSTESMLLVVTHLCPTPDASGALMAVSLCP